ncbi:MAG: TSUP family transporter [Rhodocyclaceae bacterium]|nr:TSUP family transporter [Rhodocyclaceae bacterium]
MFDWIVYLPISGTEINGFALILLGFTVGVIGGFFGVGGAFMVTPALNVFGFPMAYAIGTDMAHIAGKSIVATAKHRKFGNVDVKLGVLMIVGTVIGIEVGATLIMWLEKIGRIGPIVRTTYVILLFGLGFFMLVEYIKTARGLSKGAPSADVGKSKLALRMQQINLPPMIDLKVSGFKISLWVIVGVGVLTGFLAGFLGVGGGFIRMPALMYVIGSPTKVAVGTDLFEVMFSGAYGAFSYAMKGRVEILAAVIMLIGAAIGAQIGATATLYARGTIIRLYFAYTMMAAGVSVIFKHISEENKAVYQFALNEWAKATSGLSDKVDLGIWLNNNKEAVKAWLVQQPEAIQQAQALAKMWSSYSGYLMLGSACGLSAVIMFWLVRGVLRERAEARTVETVAREGARGQMVIAASCQPADLPAIRMGAQIAHGMGGQTVLLVCEEAGVCESHIQEGKQILEQAGITPTLKFVQGTPHKEILAGSADAHILVMGSRPLDPARPNFYLGDNTTKVVRSMTTSTLVVRGRDQVRKILLCLDVPHSQATVAMAREVALATGATLEMLYVAALPTLFTAYTAEMPPGLDHSAVKDFLSEYYEKELKILAGIKDELSAAGVREVSVRLREGIVEEEILRESVEGDFDLIVLKEGFLKTPFGLFLGRLSSSVAAHSPQASVLIVKR